MDSHKPKYQYIDEDYIDSFIVSLHGSGFLFVTKEPLWKLKENINETRNRK